MSNHLPSDQDRLPIYSPRTDELLARVAGARFPSELHGILPETARAKVSPDEVDVIAGAVKARRAYLIAPAQEPLELPESTVQEKPWSPTMHLPDVPEQREPDYRERQLPNGDR